MGWMTVKELIEVLQREPCKGAFVIVEAGGDGAVHSDMLRRVTHDREDQAISIRNERTVTLTGEA